MQIGPYTLYSIETSEFALDGGAMFGIIPKPLWEKKAPSDDQNRISMVTRSLLLVSEDRKIIVDTGNGSKWQEKFKDIYRIELDNMNMERSLNKYGFNADGITDVYCTHLHFDHIGGNIELKKLDRVGETGKVELRSPHGRHQRIPHTNRLRHPGYIVQHSHGTLIKTEILNGVLNVSVLHPEGAVPCETCH